MDATTPRRIAIRLQNTASGVTVRVYRVGDEPGLVAVCRQRDCAFRVVPGRYHVHVSDGPSTLGGDSFVMLKHDSTLLVDPKTDVQRGAGFCMAALGTLTVVATVLFQPRLGDARDTNTVEAFFFKGAAMSAVGWSVYGTSSRPDVDVIDAHGSAALRRGPNPEAMRGLQFRAAF